MKLEKDELFLVTSEVELTQLVANGFMEEPSRGVKTELVLTGCHVKFI